MTSVLNELRWPEPLAWMADEMKDGSFQAFSQFQPDAGPPIRRATTTPIPTLRGTFKLGTREWSLVDQMFAKPGINIYSIMLRKPDRLARVTFVKAPFVKQDTIVDGSHTRVVEIELVEHSTH